MYTDRSFVLATSILALEVDCCKALRILMIVPVSRSLANFSFAVKWLPPVHFGAGRQFLPVVRRFCLSGGGWRLVSVGTVLVASLEAIGFAERTNSNAGSGADDNSVLSALLALSRFLVYQRQQQRWRRC